ncbi:hypothetical protein B0H11DRAFT_2229020 [Mycena galericulata]|nr:hypothetical protein B0H11DRAFT_2229020 [Mycena galericulata]
MAIRDNHALPPPYLSSGSLPSCLVTSPSFRLFHYHFDSFSDESTHHYEYAGRMRHWDGLIGLVMRPRNHTIGLVTYFISGHLVFRDTFEGTWQMASQDALAPSWGGSVCFARAEEWACLSARFAHHSPQFRLVRSDLHTTGIYSPCTPLVLITSNLSIVSLRVDPADLISGFFAERVFP